VNPRLELGKLKRILHSQGSTYTFIRQGLNKYKVPDNTLTKTFELIGLFHESSSYVKFTTGDAARIKSSPQPMMLTEFSSASELLSGDILTITNGKKYKVVEVKDVLNLGLICDISLEVVA
jgi:hypothetical protein